jgi:acyl-CoA dehydrogenase
LSSQDQSLIWQTAERIFEDLAHDATSKDALMSAVVENGLALTWVPEDLGGVGGDVADGYDVIRLAGRYAVAVPLVEMLVAGRIAALAGADVPEGVTTIATSAPASSDGPVTLRAVPFARESERILVALDCERIGVFETSAATVRERQNDIGAARCDVVSADLDHPTAVLTPPLLLGETSRLDVEGVVARAVQTAGALEAVLAMSVQYAREREAFGRPIAKFQAVQHMLARIAEEVAAALTAARSAADTLESPPEDETAVLLEVASAKVRVTEAADTAMSLAHQVHGAIGITNDYRLQRYARLIIGWRDDFGAPAAWASRLGAVVARGGGASIWPTLTTR